MKINNEKLKNEKLLPAIVFVFSRKQVDLYASKIQIPLHDEDSKLPTIVKQECIKLLQKKLPNWKEYTNLKEFDTIHFFGDKTYEGGNDYEIFNHPKTIGHTVTEPADTLKLLSELF